MYPKLYRFLYLVVALALAAVGANAQAPASQPPAASIRGHVADPTGARIPGALVTVTNAMGVPVKSVTANGTGDYSITGLASGSYIVEASRSGFALYTSPTFKLEAGQAKVFDVKMELPIAQQQVQVSSDSQDQVSTEAGANTNAIILKGKDLDALSDDPDELSNELQALAGPAAGPNGGQIYIDGFTGGQLPPKSAIRQIIINQNPFSAEFDRLGYGRIEILTKPGTDTLHGRVFAMGNDNVFNTGDPFLSPLPSYYSYMFNGTVSGPLSKWASYFFTFQRRSFQNASVYTIPGGPILDPTTNLYSLAPSGSRVSGSVISPSTHLLISPRIDMQLGQKNTLTLRYQYFSYDQSNLLGGTQSFPSQASSSNSNENTVQLDDTQIVNDHLVNETRVEYRRGITLGVPVATTPSISAQGEFSLGGSSSQYSNDHSLHLELQNFTTLTAGKHAIKFGIWARDNREANSSNGGFNGSFIFSNPTAFVDTWNGVQQGQTIAQIAAACPSGQTCTPIRLNYTTGPTDFSANVFDNALFYQDDWKVNPFLTISLGMRWESQNHVADHSDWAPRFAFAYALDGHKKGTVQKTVIRGGFGFFYDRFQDDSLMDLEQFNGGARSQTQTVINNPTCFTSTSLSSVPGGVSSCGAGTESAPQIDVLDPTYHSPYDEMLGLSLERQLTKTSTLTFTYLHSLGLHQMATINANAYLPGTFEYGSSTLTGVRPNPNLPGLIDEFFPEAVYKENQLIVNIHAQVTRKFNLMGFYNASWANANTGDAENSYNLRDSYGRAHWVSPQWLFLMGSYTGPLGISYSPFMIARGGNPYNLTTPFDLTGDNFFNDRPGVVDSSDCTAGSSQYFDTSFGCLDITPTSGEALVPFDPGNSPSSVAVNFRLSRSFGIGPEIEGPGGPQRGGGFHGRGGRFGGPFGGGGGGPFGGPAGTGRKYSLEFSVQALNLFNNVNYGTPEGTVSETSFGKSTSLAGGIFSTGSASRRIFFQTSFQF